MIEWDRHLKLQKATTEPLWLQGMHFRNQMVINIYIREGGFNNGKP